ncbi:uncharacterized protein DUF2637 [Rhodococcus rhodochrous J45]|uniref:Uncharacterized protein DUF2637 n=1 Tax=Rhodococcus rhodochrous J45 TaxID=935266 RepID=A0A562DIK0_RHORH|nr:DUF2637 domain-containing protein [Rhodococcus rhodochrous]TWH09393.1 uncharacterized protein DUF2637 [Rhodococcus rhodochrous J45]
MSDDPTSSAPPLQEKMPPAAPKMVGVAAVATMALVLAALAFTLSFDALRALAIEINIRPDRAWMAPVAIDVAQAAATAGYVIFRVANRHAWARRYCMSLAVVTVALSVVGNSYHSYQLAARNLARVAVGEMLDFIPQPPAIAAVIAAIFPLLWLALFHLFTMMLQVVIDERAQRRDAAPAHHLAHRKDNSVASPHGEAEKALEREATLVAAVTSQNATSEVGAPDRRNAPHDASQNESAESGVAAVATAYEIPVADVAVDHRGGDATRNGYPQTPGGLHQFLADGTFTDSVKNVAAMLIDEPHLRQTQVARRLHVDKSTVSRRWRLFVAAAATEGFTVPPLPATDATEMVRELQPA